MDAPRVSCTLALQADALTHVTAQLWHYRETFKRHVKLHPAVLAGKITYTFIGSGDLWDMVSMHHTLPAVKSKPVQ